MALQTSAGILLSLVEGAPATYDAAGFGALTLVDVGDIESIGEFGGTSQINNFTGLTDIVVQKFKGAFDAGSFGLGLGQDRSDAGQALLVAAAVPTNNAVQSVSVTFTNGDIAYFTCIISSYTTNISDVNSIVKSTAQIELNNLVVFVAAV